MWTVYVNGVLVGSFKTSWEATKMVYGPQMLKGSWVVKDPYGRDAFGSEKESTAKRPSVLKPDSNLTKNSRGEICIEGEEGEEG